MSDSLRHECGLAAVRLMQPLSYYEEKYGATLWGFQRLYLLMEKQHNRGQDGAGIGAVRFDMPPGLPYISRARSIKSNPLERIFGKLMAEYRSLINKGIAHPEFPKTLKENFDFAAEVMIGHLRYGTSGGYSEKSCHPYLRKSNWTMRNLLLAGNFNMTNADQLNRNLIGRGQHPVFDTDTQTILEEVGFHLDEEHDRLYHLFRDEHHLSGEDNARRISETLDPARVLEAASAEWDGGYSIVGLLGNGDLFALRDPWGIRPLYCLRDSEVIAYASERAPLMTVFQKSADEIEEVTPGSIHVIKKAGEFYQRTIRKPRARKSCSFESIYFSRGNDVAIYEQRKRLGSALVPQILESIGGDLEKTVFSYIPNTSEVAYYGLMQGLRRWRRQQVKDALRERLLAGTLREEDLDPLIMANWPRSEKVANKDIKLRTFIAREKGRSELVSHVYDISYGSVEPGEYLVCLDDSIVRGTTLRESIIKILARLQPKKIVIASTAPQIRYPDCYGIDMSELGRFIAFQAVVSLLRESGRESLLKEVYADCIAQRDKPDTKLRNHVARIYEAFSEQDVARRISDLVRPELSDWQGGVEVLFLPVAAMHEALGEGHGDWYFTGNYPTPGGYRALNNAYINYYEERKDRSY